MFMCMAICWITANLDYRGFPDENISILVDADVVHLESGLFAVPGLVP